MIWIEYNPDFMSPWCTTNSQISGDQEHLYNASKRQQLLDFHDKLDSLVVVAIDFYHFFKSPFLLIASLSQTGYKILIFYVYYLVGKKKFSNFKALNMTIERLYCQL